jgi:hypothetical protein
MTIMDKGSANPRLQCGECGRWMRLHGKDKAGKAFQRFYGGCGATDGDHPCGKDVCSDCCPVKCQIRLGCDCQHPETTKGGFAAKSQICPVHGETAGD